MKTANIHEAKARFSSLVKAAEAGETTIISRAGKPVARLSPIEKPKRSLGVDDGLGFIAEDFDAPLPSDLLQKFYE